MSKFVITQEQADRINYFRKDNERKEMAVGHHIDKWNAPVNTCLNELSLSELIAALYIGYEVEEKFEVGDFVVVNQHGDIWTSKIAKITHDEIAVYVDDCPFVDNKQYYVFSRLRHATESEIAEEEKRRTNKKLDEILLDLSDDERDGLYKKLVRGDY